MERRAPRTPSRNRSRQSSSRNFFSTTAQRGRPISLARERRGDRGCCREGHSHGRGGRSWLHRGSRAWSSTGEIDGAAEPQLDIQSTDGWAHLTGCLCQSHRLFSLLQFHHRGFLAIPGIPDIKNPSVGFSNAVVISPELIRHLIAAKCRMSACHQRSGRSSVIFALCSSTTAF